MIQRCFIDFLSSLTLGKKEILPSKPIEKQRTAKTGLAKVVAQCSADTFVVNQSLDLHINICAENRHLRQARKH